MAGRKENYAETVKPRLTTILAWKRKGLIDKEIAANLGVGLSTFSRYKAQYKELRDALKIGKDDADAQVENALFRSAIGYEYDEVHVTTRTLKVGKTKQVYRRTIRKFIPPDKTAMIFYLKNRKSEDWKDQRQVGIGGIDGQPLPNVHIILPDNGMNKDDDDSGK